MLAEVLDSVTHLEVQGSSSGGLGGIVQLLRWGSKWGCQSASQNLLLYYVYENLCMVGH